MKNTIIVCLTLIANGLGAQHASDWQIVQDAFAPPPKVRLTERYADSQNNPNELQFVLSGLFLAYKAFISNQDQNRCAFAPSCSEYGLQAVKKFGVVRGVVSTTDRLLRCNGYSPEKYTIDPKAMRLSDPVQW